MLHVAAASTSKTIAAELAPHVITVNTIATGSSDTNAAQQFLAAMAARSAIPTSSFIAMLKQQTPVGRIGKREEMAALAACLCSDLVGFTTGELVSCDGGFANDTY